MSQALERASAFYREGRHAEAAEACHALLADAPGSAEALLLMSRIAVARRDAQAALDWTERAVATLPGQAEAHLLRGMACMMAGRLAEAGAALDRALALEPTNAKVHLKLGTLAARLGEPERAFRHFRAALAARPRYAKAASSLGNQLRELGRIEEAVPHLEQAWRWRPREPGIASNHALGLAAAGRVEEAVALLRETVASHPDEAVAFANLGSLLLQLGRPAEAIDALERASALAPSLVEALANHATALMELGRLAESRVALERMMTDWPGHAGPWLNLGHLARIEGRLEEAQRYFERAADLDPANVEALAEIAAQARERTPAPRRQALEGLLAAPGLGARQRSRVHFALATIHDGAGEVDVAFRHLAEGNALRRAEDAGSGRAFDPAKHAASIDRLIATFTPALFERHGGAGDPSEIPVYVVGMPRSGTTLVEQILASHPDIHGAGERNDLRKLAKRLVLDTGTSYPRCVRDVTPSMLRRFGEELAECLENLAPEAARVVDKQPTNFLHLGLAALMLPSARFIHCRRHPVATGFSCFEQNFRTGNAWSRDLADIARYYHDYDRLMRHWRTVLPVALHEVRYEDLVADAEPAIRGLLAFCGVPWDPRCLDFHRTDRPVRTASQRQVRRPLYRASIDRWRSYEAHLGPLTAALEDLTAEYQPTDPHSVSTANGAAVQQSC